MILEGCKTKRDTYFMKIDHSEVNKSIETLSSKKVFFGHASVGYDIVAGIETLISNNKIINIFEMKEEFIMDKNGFYHKMNGKNSFPKSKCDGFKDFLIGSNIGNKFDIAFFKFCFVDFDEHTDVKAILDYYVETVDSIKKNFPNLTILHITTPLTTHLWGLKGFIKNLIKGDIANVKRNQYNQLLIDRYADNEPLYDLAKIESTRPDGSRSSFKYKGQTYYSLHKGYTTDGGHLNELGRRIAAQELLEVLVVAACNSK